MFDWSTGLTGLRIGQIADLAGLYIAEKNRLRNAEEQKRLLYVAMTRAREHLIISCAPSSRRSSGSFLAMLDSTLDDSIAGAESSTRVALGKGTVEIEVVQRELDRAQPRAGQSQTLEEKTQLETLCRHLGAPDGRSMRRRNRPRHFSRRRCSNARKKRAPKPAIN